MHDLVGFVTSFWRNKSFITRLLIQLKLNVIRGTQTRDPQSDVGKIIGPKYLFKGYHLWYRFVTIVYYRWAYIILIYFTVIEEWRFTIFCPDQSKQCVGLYSVSQKFANLYLKKLSAGSQVIRERCVKSEGLSMWGIQNPVGRTSDRERNGGGHISGLEKREGDWLHG